MYEDLKKIIKEFKIEGNLARINENQQGNINSTYVLEFNNNGTTNKYLLQKINTIVFKDPYLVMKNIELISNHINKKLKMTNNTTYKHLNYIKTSSDELLYTHINENGKKDYYRVCEYI